MELCKGDNPEPSVLRNRHTMRISFSLHSSLPPIQNWPVVARKANGESQIYESFADFQERSSSNLQKESSSENESKPELAAFPTMAQAISYLKSHASLSSPPSASTRQTKIRMENLPSSSMRIVSDDGENDSNSQGVTPPKSPLGPRVSDVGDQTMTRKRPLDAVPPISSLQIPSVPTGLDPTKRMKTGTTKLDALAMAAASNCGKGASKMMAPTSPAPTANIRIGAGVPGARGVISPHSLLRLTQLGRISGYPESSLVQNATVMTQQSYYHHQQQKRNSLSSTLKIPEVPTALKIPEVPRGPVPALSSKNMNQTTTDLPPRTENGNNNNKSSISSLMMMSAMSAGHGSALRTGMDMAALDMYAQQRQQQCEKYTIMLQEAELYRNYTHPFQHHQQHIGDFGLNTPVADGRLERLKKSIREGTL